jgi:hypothetical protein
MKLKSITIGFILMCSLLACTASAATENKDLPTEQEITNYLSGLQISNNFVTSASEASLSDNPSWKWDTWKDTDGNSRISFYYTIDSAKGYGSLYYDDSGKQFGKMCGMETTLVKSYTGEAVKDDTKEEEVTETPTEEEEEEIIETPAEEEKVEEELVKKCVTETPVKEESVKEDTPEEEVTEEYIKETAPTEAKDSIDDQIKSMSKESKYNILLKLLKSLFED